MQIRSRDDELCAMKIFSSEGRSVISQTRVNPDIENSAKDEHSEHARETAYIRGQILFSILNAHARMRRERLKRVRRCDPLRFT